MSNVVRYFSRNPERRANNAHFEAGNPNVGLNKLRYQTQLHRSAEKLGLDATVLAVLLVLLNHLNTKSGECFPSQRTIGKKIRRGPRTVQRAIATLKTKGLVQTDTTNRHGKSLRYFILPLEEDVVELKPVDDPRHECRTTYDTGVAPPASPMSHEHKKEQKNLTMAPSGKGDGRGFQKVVEPRPMSWQSLIPEELRQRLRTIDLKSYETIGPWEEWLEAEGLPDLGSYPMIYRSKSGEKVLTAPFERPPEGSSERKDAREFFAAMTDLGERGAAE